MEKFNNDLICGFPISKIKRILKNHQNSFISIETILDILYDKEKSKSLLKDLVNNGYLEETNYPDRFLISSRGNKLLSTKIKRFLTDDVRMKKINLLLKKAEEVNDDNYFLYYVDQIVLLKRPHDPNNIYADLKLSTKYPNKEEKFNLENRRRLESNKLFSNIVEELFYPQVEIRKFLKAAKHNLIVSIDECHDWEEKELIFFRTK